MSMSKTPTKREECGFIPKEIATPSIDSPGISKTVFTHVTRLHSLLNDWIRICDKGTTICKAIMALELQDCNNDFYPHQLNPLMENLIEAVDSLKNIIEGVETIDKQLVALAKLQATEQPVIFTWSAKRISLKVNEMCSSLHKEYKLKQVISENIAHCRDENLIEVYVSAWQFDIYFDMDSNAYLFAEVGLTGIT